MTKNGPGLPIDCCRSSTRALKSNLYMWIIAVGVLILLPVTAAHQEGRYSIDCGSTSDHRDQRGLEWEPDDEFISTDLGTNRKVTVPENQGDNKLELSTARYFQSDRTRFCYIFPNVTYNGSYLIRASFLYGDLVTPLPAGYSFNLAIDSSVVGKIGIGEGDINTTVTLEYFVVARSQEIAFCLLPLIGGPFISSLELRPLESQMYASYMFPSQYGVLTQRLNCGANITDPAIRFPYDEFDRIWETPNSSYSIDTVTTTTLLIDIGDLYDLDYAPLEVMQSAWQSDLEFSFTVDFAQNQKYYAAFLFAEIRSFNASDLTVIDIQLNGEEWYTNVTLANFSATAKIEMVKETSTASVMNFTIRAEPVSTLPPLLNGFEIHAVYAANTTTTASSDRQVLDDVRGSLGLTDWTGDPCLPIPFDWLTCTSGDPAMVTQIKLSGYQLQGTIPPSIGGLAALKDLWLENNLIAGTIPDLSNLTKLQTLHLQNNSLEGAIPDSLANIPLLKQLFLQQNSLNGSVPAALLNKNGLDLKADSYNLQGASPQSPAPGSKSGSKGVSVGAIIGAVASGAVALVLLLGAFLYCLRKRRSATSQQYPTKTSDQKGGNVQSTKAFSLAEVYRITNNFEERIGEGGFGPVYFGKLDNGTEVAVKVNSETSGQGLTEFSTEVRLLSRIHHRNLVQLIGFCDEGNKKILIYEFMKAGTVREHLYGKEQNNLLDWSARLQIAIDAARGLEYLHYDCHPRIIHRDVKSTNILLNENLQAKMTDFGISKSHEEDTTADFSTVVKGTTGYLDPEYYSTTKLTYKSDVYAFGVVLLEIISGRAPVNRKLVDQREWGLVDYARQMLSESKLEIIADKSLGDNCNKEAMWKVAELAMRCVEPRSVNRPEMREVVKELVEATQYEHGIIEPMSSSYITTSESGTEDTTQSFTRNTPSRLFPTRPKPDFLYHPSHQKSNPAFSSNRRETHDKTDTAPWAPPAPR